MSESVCENCIPKRIMVSSEKNPKEVDFFQARITEIAL